MIVRYDITTPKLWFFQISPFAVIFSLETRPGLGGSFVISKIVNKTYMYDGTLTVATMKDYY